LNRIQILLVLLLLIPGAVNLATPIYNYKDPALFGLPFFYWFQIFALGLSTLPYLAFTMIEDKRSRVGPKMSDGGH
jgi:hypothetical protein